ncbi:hypothetical protein [Streptomyces sp. 891-h]|uniref:hypothetical protein n=1 Tax=Streptomyces sp. 891-h TaxID=2720714 RepID=UPI001FA9F1FB|nr:hypothetical protein [Streptomyces sp. 891-h]
MNSLDSCRGALVRDEETGFVGIPMDVVVRFPDPQGCPHPETERRGGVTYCAVCGVQLYL